MGTERHAASDGTVLSVPARRRAVVEGRAAGWAAEAAGRGVTDGQVELTVAVGMGDSGAGERSSGAEATVTLVDARRDGVIAVHVAAIVDNGVRLR